MNRPSWREERRLDLFARAQIARENEDAQARRSEDSTRARQERRAAGRTRRAACARAASAWLADHAVGALLAPIIGVSAAISWTGMAAYGETLCGTTGLSLPALSEGAAWAFAAATTARQREDDRRQREDPAAAQRRPLLHLRLGTLVFAVIQAVLNFLHGMAEAGMPSGIAMAVISVSGISAHQLITAGPRRARAQRDADAITRYVARRELKARKAAVRAAPVELDGTGRARLVFKAGGAAVTSSWLRTRLDECDLPASHPSPTVAGPSLADLVGAVRFAVTAAVTAAAIPAVNRAASGDGTVPPGEDETAGQDLVPAVTEGTSESAADAVGSGAGAQAGHTAGTPVTETAEALADAAAEAVIDLHADPPATPRARPKRPAGRATRGAKADKVTAAIRANPTMTNKQIADRTRVSESTVERARRQLREVGGQAEGQAVPRARRSALAGTQAAPASKSSKRPGRILRKGIAVKSADYEQSYADYWRDIIEFPDGELNLDQVRRELHDYLVLMRHAAEVYDSVSGGLISKAETMPCHVIDAAGNRVERAAADAVTDLITVLERSPERAFASVADVAAFIRELAAAEGRPGHTVTFDLLSGCTLFVVTESLRGFSGYQADLARLGDNEASRTVWAASAAALLAQVVAAMGDRG